jgi:hypothetical protein
MVMQLIHHGGGRSNSPNDNLYLFKKRFGQNTEFKFHIGKKVWNEEIYKELCKIKGIDDQVDFFPAYRKNRTTINYIRIIWRLLYGYFKRKKIIDFRRI